MLVFVDWQLGIASATHAANKPAWRTRKTLPKRYSARSNAEALTQLTAVLKRRSPRATARLDGLDTVTMSPGAYSKTRLPKDTGGSLPLAAPRYAERFSAPGSNGPIGKFNPCVYRKLYPIATNFMVGRCTASAMASASRKSFFWPF